MKYDVYGLGNALVDLQVAVEPRVVESTGNPPGSMVLVDGAARDRIVAQLEASRIMLHAGGSAANTMAGVAALGGKACFTGCVSEDEFGRSYRRSLREAGVEFFAQRGDGTTGSCIVLITPDAQRTFLTHLGCSASITPDGVRQDAIRQSRWLYVEGYLWDGSAADACRHAMALARKHGTRVAFTASDAFCVERHLGDYREILEHHADLFFANAAEAAALSGTRDVAEAARSLARHCGLAAVTDGASGAFIATGDRVIQVPARPVTPVDTTGAGDAFAAGFLHGITHDLTPAEAAEQGAALASEVICRFGARPRVG
ncbi:MAG: adenosine kinase [Planctomycetes bacterium]|nr:adenosine kinase [Planctomycetota bacterium]